MKFDKENALGIAILVGVGYFIYNIERGKKQISDTFSNMSLLNPFRKEDITFEKAKSDFQDTRDKSLTHTFIPSSTNFVSRVTNNKKSEDITSKDVLNIIDRAGASIPVVKSSTSDGSAITRIKPAEKTPSPFIPASQIKPIEQPKQNIFTNTLHKFTSIFKK